MKSLTLFIGIMAIAGITHAQSDEQSVKSFRKVVVSPKINLVLKEGQTESVRLEYHGVERDQIMVEVRGKKLHIYLEDAKIFDRPVREERHPHRWRSSQYRHASVTAYVTYRQLEGIESRGEEEVVCESPISSRRFRIAAYGEVNIRIGALETGTLRTKLYGVNSLRITDGEVGHQKYALYGENKIDTRGLLSKTAVTTVYGEGRIMLRATDELHLNSFGEPQVIVEGSPIISKGLIFGTPRIRRY